MKKYSIFLFVLAVLLTLTACAETNTQGKTEGPPNSEQSQADVAEIIDVNYLLMWHHYEAEEYKGKHIRIAGKIDYLGSDTINIKEGLSGLTGNIYLKFNKDNNNVDQLESLKEGDYIIAVGECGSKTLGQISIDNVYIEITGDEAFERVKEDREEAEKVFEQERLEAQELEKIEMEAYKTKTTKIDYGDLVREPYKYKGEVLEVSIRITQIMAGGILTEAGYVGKQGNNQWYINYELPESSPRILVGDAIKFYGEFVDVVEMKTALTNTKVYVPKLKAKYFEFSK